MKEYMVLHLIIGFTLDGILSLNYKAGVIHGDRRTLVSVTYIIAI